MLLRLLKLQRSSEIRAQPTNCSFEQVCPFVSRITAFRIFPEVRSCHPSSNTQSLSPASIESSLTTRFFLKIMSDALIAILVIHDGKLHLPSNSFRWVNVLRKASWRASSASPQ